MLFQYAMEETLAALSGMAGVSRQKQTGGSYARYKVNKIRWGNGSVGQTGQKRVRSTRVKEDSWT